MTIIEMRQERARLWEQAKGLHERAKEEKRDLTAEEREQWDKLNAEIDSLKEQIDREERAQAIEADLAAQQARPEGEGEERQGPAGQAEYRDVFRAYLRNGMSELSPEQRQLLRSGHQSIDGAEARALGVGAGPIGGFTVPDEAMRPIVDALAAVGGVRAGDYILAIDGQPLGAGENVDRLLERRVGDRVELRVAAAADGRNARTVAVKPVSTSAEAGLRYRAWVERNRAYVHEMSNGSLGYVHMADMGWPSLQQLIVDLDAENFGRDGVVIDLRGNRGGFVNAYALDVFARRGYITMEIRGFPVAPARSMLGQRSLEVPTALVIDLNSLSDAEDFTEGYRALELGPVVGEPTAGWIIYTWNLPLVDGSTFRMPRSRIRGAAGDDMELYPRPVDVQVVRPLGEGLSGRDSQLDAAIRALVRP